MSFENYNTCTLHTCTSQMMYPSNAWLYSCYRWAQSEQLARWMAREEMSFGASLELNQLQSRSGSSAVWWKASFPFATSGMDQRATRTRKILNFSWDTQAANWISTSYCWLCRAWGQFTTQRDETEQDLHERWSSKSWLTALQRWLRAAGRTREPL